MTYKKSRIYRLGFDLAFRVEEVCRKLPTHERYSLAQQLRRASRSVVANYVEAFVRQHSFPRDHKRFITYSQGSCDETKFWLEFLAAIGLTSKEIVEDLVEGYSEVGKLLNPILRKNTRTL
ncbi:MAG: four helix bundle protein [Acidobacteria bacterium]|nr:four helix bundle protein [Acidobacteriota bacterium]